MRNKRIIFSAVIAVSLTLILMTINSCKQEGMSKSERIQNFIDDLNTSSRSGIEGNFSSLSAVAATSTFFNSTVIWETDNQPFGFTQTGSSGDNVTGVISTGTVPINVRFEMSSTTLSGILGGEDWKIDLIYDTDLDVPIAGVP